MISHFQAALWQVLGLNGYWYAGALLFVIFFAYGEYNGFAHSERTNTLSRTVSTIGAKWPFSIFLAGGLTVGLAVHFYWAWPTNPLAGGG